MRTKAPRVRIDVPVPAPPPAASRRSDGPRIEHVTFELVGTDPGRPPSPVTDATMARLHARRPDLAAALAPLLPELLAHEGRLFRWLREDPGRGRAFLVDPIGTLEAVCALPSETAARLRALAAQERSRGRAS
jgi:hypothetical protein